MTEISEKELTILDGAAIVDLIGTLWPIRRAEWMLGEEKKALADKLSGVVGQCAILGQKFSIHNLTAEARTTMRKKGEVDAHLEYLHSQYALAIDHIDATLTAVLNPADIEPAKLHIVAHDGVKDAFGGFDPWVSEVSGIYENLNISGNIWVRDEDGHAYQVRVFNRELEQQADIEVEYPKSA
jgi:hypothetical protein